MWITSMGNHGAVGVSKNAAVPVDIRLVLNNTMKMSCVSHTASVFCHYVLNKLVSVSVCMCISDYNVLQVGMKHVLKCFMLPKKVNSWYHNVNDEWDEWYVIHLAMQVLSQKSFKMIIPVALRFSWFSCSQCRWKWDKMFGHIMLFLFVSEYHEKQIFGSVLK